MSYATSLPNTDSISWTGSSRSYAISVDNDLASIEPQWQELENDGNLTPFQTRAWLLPWYRIIAPVFGIAPVFVTLRDKISGRPLMLLLLCVRRHHGVTVIHFPDCGVSDYNAPLFAADFQPTDEEFAVLWKDIARVLPKADLINFEKMPETVANRPNPMARFVGAQRMRLSAWGFSLPKRRADYDQLLKSVVRKELRRKRRNLEVEGQIRYVRPQSAAQGREFFETLCRQRAARYRELGRPDILGDPLFLRFYEAVIFDNWATQYGALSALMVGEEIAATLFALSHRDRYLLLMHCFETGRWGLKSPGIVAVDSAITDQIESGTGYFDLTVGNESYKLQFGVKENFLYSYEQTISPLGWAYMAVRNAKRFASEQVRKLPRKYLPENLR